MGVADQKGGERNGETACASLEPVSIRALRPPLLADRSECVSRRRWLVHAAPTARSWHRLTDAQAWERRFHASYVLIEVVVGHDTNVSAGEAGEIGGQLGQTGYFRPGKYFTRSGSGNAKVQASPDTSAEQRLARPTRF